MARTKRRNKIIAQTCAGRPLLASTVEVVVVVAVGGTAEPVRGKKYGRMGFTQVTLIGRVWLAGFVMA